MEEDSNIHESWKPVFDKWEQEINNNLKNYENSSSNVFPQKKDIFKIFSMDVALIKIVFLGQDPYHGKGQANGLAFSANNDCKIPPSLQNIYKELKLEFPERNYDFAHGNLERWVFEEKIFLLNSSLTVLESKPSSHMKLWSSITDNVIKFISENNKQCIFLLLGNYSKTKLKFIENGSLERCIIGTHPSPLSAHRGFFNSNIFRLCEEKLGHEINWNI